MYTKQSISQRQAQIKPFIRYTPVEQSPMLAADGGMVWLKLENQQITGSFKVRGAMSKLLALSPAQRQNGVVTASTGNHGAAVAYAAKCLETTAVVYVPTDADPGKVERIRRYGGQVQFYGSDCVETEVHARKISLQLKKPFVSPYNDPDVIIGQGSIAVELLQQVPHLDAVFIAIGGGGMIGGVGSYIKAVNPNIEVVGCSPLQSPAMHECMLAGAAIDVPCFPTLSDATAGGVEHGSITVDVCCRVVDRSLLVSEAEIAQSTFDVIDAHRMLIEGAAGVAVAGYRKVKEDYRGKNVGIVLCGANIGMEKLKKVLSV